MKRTANIIRILTAPPLCVTALIVFLCICTDCVFLSRCDIVFSIIFLAILPALAYVFAPLIFLNAKTRRARERKTALILTPICYAAAFIYGITTGASAYLLMIYAGYFISSVILFLINSFTPVRASGHACAVSGPLLYAAYHSGPLVIPAFLIIYFAVFGASLFLKRHTAAEFLAGTAVCAFAFALSLIIYNIAF